MEFREQTFEGVVVDLDDNTYTGCTFNRCTLVYRGGGTGRFAANRFDEHCTWNFRGPAWTTLKYLRYLYNSGEYTRTVAEQWIDFIRTPLKDPDSGQDPEETPAE